MDFPIVMLLFSSLLLYDRNEKNHPTLRAWWPTAALQIVITQVYLYLAAERPVNDTEYGYIRTLPVEQSQGIFHYISIIYFRAGEHSPGGVRTHSIQPSRSGKRR
jgi:hypothetical protein